MTVEVENQANGIRIIKLTGASASKSFSRESLPIIANAIDDGLKDSEIKGMVITGDGKFFSAGADIHAFQEAIDANEAPQLIRDLTNILHPLLMRITRIINHRHRSNQWSCCRRWTWTCTCLRCSYCLTKSKTCSILCRNRIVSRWRNHLASSKTRWRTT